MSRTFTPSQFYTVSLIAGLTLLALIHYYPCDDAYISYRYALNWAQGKGLVWNEGERVEGYSNFLWTLLIGVSIKVGIPPETFISLFGTISYTILLILIYRLGLRLFPEERLDALWGVLLTGINHSLWGFARSGMETVPFAALVSGFMLGVVRVEENPNDKGRWLLLGIMIALLPLLRPDGALFSLWGIGMAVSILRMRLIGISVSFRKRAFALLILPVIFIWTIYGGWKWLYYHSLLPNSFHIKVQGLTGIGFGIYYLYTFALTHFLVPYLLLWALFFRHFTANDLFGKLQVVAGLWLIYTLVIGGDFMEFRFLTPIIPFLNLIFLKIIHRFSHIQRFKTALSLGILAGAVHAIWVVLPYGMESAKDLKNHLLSPRENWIGIGKRLGELFGGTDVVISVGAGGAIPYFSGLKCVDFIGLTDSGLAKVGIPFTRVPGHRLIAPVEYLRQRGVHLIIEPNNYMFDRKTFSAWSQQASWLDLQYRFYFDLDRPIRGERINEVTFVGIPIDEEFTLAAWYLQFHREVERKIAEEGWKRVVIRRY
ncbi:MAG: ArnT family glycosyltransferase [bacterium]